MGRLSETHVAPFRAGHGLEQQGDHARADRLDAAADTGRGFERGRARGNDAAGGLPGRNALDRDLRRATEEQRRGERRLARLAVIERPEADRGWRHVGAGPLREVDHDIRPKACGRQPGIADIAAADPVGTGRLAPPQQHFFQRKQRRQGRGFAGPGSLADVHKNLCSGAFLQRLDEPEHPAGKRGIVDPDEKLCRAGCRRRSRHRCDERSVAAGRGPGPAGWLAPVLAPVPSDCRIRPAYASTMPATE